MFNYIGTKHFLKRGGSNDGVIPMLNYIGTKLDFIVFPLCQGVASNKLWSPAFI